MDWWRAGDHAAVLTNVDEFRKTCSPEGRFAHYLMLAGAFGGPNWTMPGEQFGRYEAAIGTGQSNFGTVAGLLQLNVRVPPDALAGNAVAFGLIIGGDRVPGPLTIALR